ncbi:tetratricopeptide repeat protein [Blastopirellula marina]|uniref:Tetratricopeptide repeat protein n=1 Tax=Blastopirellula marina TaxID=124 RepID=A0A2S8GHB4_9BACT|nr:tetratricopeptide repeat protein [Blastopirellula marina]PQO43859.1 hypothetical protein C5Y93_21985 [Blastopirellula marina]
MMNQLTRHAVLTLSALALFSVGCSSIPLKSPFGGKPTTSLGESTLPPQDAAKVCVSTAKQLHERGDLAQAAAMLERGRALAPKGYDYSRHLASLYSDLDAAKAETEYQASLAQSPSDADLWNDYGYFQYRQNRFADAEKSYARALELDPQHEKANMNLAVNLVSQNRLPEAFTRFENSVGPAAAHQNIGVLLAKQGRRDEARVAFGNALQITPNSRSLQLF